jgi:DNA excision repair protein ERCC-3
VPYTAVQAFYPSAVEFIIAIAEPVSRPRFVHEYVVTDVSLHSAVALGLTGAVILKKLDLLCKTDLPPALARFITNSTRNAGKLRLVLFNSRYSLETVHLQMLEDVVRLPDVRAMVDGELRTRSSAPAPPPQSAASASSENGFLEGVAGGLNAADADTVHSKLAWQREFDRDDVVAATHHFAQLLPGKERDIVRTCREQGYPLVEVFSLVLLLFKFSPMHVQVYDSASDRDTAPLRIGLRCNSVLRPYQERCLAKFFSGGQANSGIIVLPCGAGKTLVGVTAAATLKKSTLIVCSSAVAVTQWKQQFLQWTTLPESDISAFTSGSREGSRAVTITTYHMIGHREKRGRWSKRGVESIANRQWGLVILDEVHMFPSTMFSTVMRGLRVHCKLGLTATLVREDSRIDALKDLIGPKLFVVFALQILEFAFSHPVFSHMATCTRAIGLISPLKAFLLAFTV